MKAFGSAVAGLLPLAALCISSVAAHPYRRDGFGVSTVTWTETRTYTSTISSYYPPANTAIAGQDCVPPPGSGQIACGPICCATWQWCSDPIKGQCLANVGQNSWTEVVTTGVTTGLVVTTQFSAPYRPTSGSISTPTGTLGSATAVPTGPQETVPADSTTAGSALSGGAIAGIVIGAIAGLALLILCCFCCIVKGLWGAFAALLGGKKKDKERVEIIEERYSRHGSQHGVRPAHKSWFGGGGGGRPADVTSRKEKKSGGGMGWLAAGAGAAALLLGLKKKDDKKRRGGSHKSRSDWSSAYYTDSYTGSSPSESILA